MATSDITRRSIKCPCGKSTVTFITSSPDHPWARDSQTSYSATIDCEKCRNEFAVYEEPYNRKPKIVYRDEVEAKKAIQEKYWALNKAIKSSEAAERLRQKIIAAVDGEPTMAARHRKLREFGLAYESYDTYRKRPYDGAEATRWALGVQLARIGNIQGLGGTDQQYFSESLAELERLDSAEKSICLRVVKLAGEPE